MRIMVFDVPAEKGGALTILNQFYNDAFKAKDIDWIFIVSKPKLKEFKNVKVLAYSWVKKSWLHRLYFDNFVAHKIVEKYQVDEILSLQNIIIPRVKVKQKLYVHQSLPFVEYKFRLKDNPKMWIYQNVIGRIIFKSIKKADQVIVQTNWMKRACIEEVGIDSSKIEVRSPEVDITVKNEFIRTETNLKTFFYPAGPHYYKNHRIIIQAFKTLKLEGITNIRVIFTLNGNENKHIANLYEESIENSLQVEFIGNIEKEKVFDYYIKSVLIFPSYIETLGLPLLEAKFHCSPILASNCEFSREVLHDYEDVFYFDPFDAKDLAKKILKVSGHTC